MRHVSLWLVPRASYSVSCARKKLCSFTVNKPGPLMKSNPDTDRDTAPASDPLMRADIPELVKAVADAMISQTWAKQPKPTDAVDPGEGTSVGASEGNCMMYMARWNIIWPQGIWRAGTLFGCNVYSALKY